MNVLQRWVPVFIEKFIYWSERHGYSFIFSKKYFSFDICKCCGGLISQSRFLSKFEWLCLDWSDSKNNECQFFKKGGCIAAHLKDEKKKKLIEMKCPLKTNEVIINNREFLYDIILFNLIHTIIRFKHCIIPIIDLNSSQREVIKVIKDNQHIFLIFKSVNKRALFLYLDPDYKQMMEEFYREYYEINVKENLEFKKYL